MRVSRDGEKVSHKISLTYNNFPISKNVIKYNLFGNEIIKEELRNTHFAYLRTICKLFSVGSKYSILNSPKTLFQHFGYLLD